uniref:anaphase-promoting complex subunit 2 isoform X2 n=1 Tax=Myxine glutinosa TaxID=7769 RepID=UPI00358E4051
MDGSACSSAWESLTALLTPGSPSDAKTVSKNEDARSALGGLACFDLHLALEPWYLDKVQGGACVGLQRCRDFHQAFRSLSSNLEPFMRGLDILEGWRANGLLPAGAHGPGSLHDHVLMLLKALVFCRSSPEFLNLARDVYNRFFIAFLHQDQKGSSQGFPRKSDGEGKADEPFSLEEQTGLEVCCCDEIMGIFHSLNDILHGLQLLERVGAEAATAVLQSTIASRVESACCGEYEQPFLSRLEEWLESKALCWLRSVLAGPKRTRPIAGHAEASLGRWLPRLQHFLYRVYAEMRVKELFSIIRDYPDSQNALQELHQCLEKTGQWQLVLTLRQALETRLLHPGVNTDDIITLYISAIRALTHLDPSGVLLDRVCEPVRKYLRCREDTVRKIVAGLTEDTDGPSELAGELARGEPIELDQSSASDDDAEEPESWKPQPVDAMPEKLCSGRRSFDIISLLVSIYGSKEVFVNEYHTLLADRVLQHFNYNMAREVRNLELLKLRFGEAVMHRCEVMLKDVADSRRINSNIHEAQVKQTSEDGGSEGTGETQLVLNAMILSGEFWPSLKEGKLELPAEVKTAMEAYTQEYEKLKAARSLNWKPHLGLVILDVELKERTLSLSVSPIHAALIIHFQNKSVWHLSELSEELATAPAILRRRLAFWQQQGVLQEGPSDVYSVLLDTELTEAAGVLDTNGTGLWNPVKEPLLLDSDDEGDSATASQADQRQEEMQVFWTYIQGMLTNLESLSLERIHSMLRMFAMMGPTNGGTGAECSLNELRSFLNRKVKDNQLICTAGIYKLPKPNL